MSFWDFVFPQRLKEKVEKARDDRKARREKEKREKKNPPKPPPPAPPLEHELVEHTPPKSTDEANSGRLFDSTCATSREMESDPLQPGSWEYIEMETSTSSPMPTTSSKEKIKKRVKDFTERSVRRVRRIGSNNSEKSKHSPRTRKRIKETTLDKFLEKVRARQESRNRSALSHERELSLHDADCPFPEDGQAVRAEVIVAKKTKDEDEVEAEPSSNKSARRKEKGEKKEEKEEERDRIDDSKREKRVKGSKERRKGEEKKGTSNRRKTRSPMVDKKGEDEKTQTPSEKSEKSMRSDNSDSSSSKKEKPSPLKQIQKIFPDLSKKGRAERKERKEKLKREKEEARKKEKLQSELFVNGRPFWLMGGKMTAAEKAELTQDDLPLNAAIVLEVKRGNLDLPELPAGYRIILDPYAPLEVLKGRDESVFNCKILFANTIRSMINSADLTNEKTKTPEKGEVKPVTLKSHPTYYWNYHRSNPTKVWREVFRWQGSGVA